MKSQLAGKNTIFFKSIPPVIVLLFFQSSAWAECADDWFGVDEVREGGNIELRATNLKEFPITYTMRVRTRGLITDGPKTITGTLDGDLDGGFEQFSGDIQRAGLHGCEPDGDAGGW